MKKEEAIDVLKANYPDSCYELLREAVDVAIEALKEEHEIGYRECSDALLKMWMDNVLTDRQYYNIMGKLFLYWEHRKREEEQ